MRVQTTCNAMTKDGPRMHVCDLALGHCDPQGRRSKHQSMVGRTVYEWDDQGGGYVGSSDVEVRG